VFAAATFTWLGDVAGYFWVQKASGHGDIPGLNTSYIGSVVMEIDEKDNVFKMNFLLAVVAASFWFKIFMMLQLTKTFGPMIKIIVSMLQDLATFTVLWIIQLFIFACIGYLIFGELNEYRDLPNTLILLLQASLGSSDYTIYNQLEIGPMYGIGFHVVVVIMNMILLLNLVIAILTETYVRFAKV
jgi:Polycystin cation channel